MTMAINIKSNLLLIILVCVIAVYANIITNSFTLEPFYSLYPDTSELYFLHTLDDSSVFTRDSFALNYSKSIGYFNNEFIFKGIYKFLLYFFPLPVAIKILSILLCLATVFIVYKISIKYFSRDFAFFPTVLFLIYFLGQDTFFGGTMRSFGILFFVTFVYLLENKKNYFLPILLSLSALFYPYLAIPIFIICAIQTIIIKENVLKKALYVLWFFLNIAIATFFTLGKGAGPIFRSALSNLDVAGAYKYTLRVNEPINPQSLYSALAYFILNLNEHGKLYLYYTFFFMLVSLIILIVRKKTALILPKSFSQMFLACMGGFILVYPMHPALASRQLNFIVPFLLVFFFSLNFYEMFKNKNIINGFFVLISSSFLIMHPCFNSIRGYEKYERVYKYAENLPKNSLIAGSPKSEIIRSMPLFSKRTVFFSEKLVFQSLAYSRQERIKRLEFLVRALYGTDPREVSEFISRYNIDYMVIEEAHYLNQFSRDLKASIRPFDKKIIEFSMGFNNIKPLLLDFAEKNYEFKGNIDGYSVYIVNARTIKDKLSGAF